LHEPQVEFGDAVLGARFLAIEVLQRDVEPVQGGAGARLGLAQFGQRGGDKGLTLGGFRFGATRVATSRTQTSLACSASVTSPVAAAQRRW